MTDKYPKKPPEYGYYPIPQALWQEDLTDAIFDNRDYNDKWLIEHGMQRRYYKDQVLQVYSNWTLHFQVAYGSEEANDGDYGNLEEKVLLSFDVESGARGIKTKDMNDLRNAVSQALLVSGCSDTLGSAASFQKHKHHIVWEAIDYDPQNAESIQAIAHRLFEYMDAIYPIAEPVLREMNG